MNRNLRFRTLQDARDEIRRIQDSVVETTGLWSLGQILNHCAEGLEYCISSYPRLAPAFLRRTIGPIAFKSMKKKGFMAPGQMNPDAPKERVEQEPTIAFLRLDKAIEAFDRYSGPFAEHPFFGTLPPEDWRLLMSFHLANHLGNVHIIGPAAQRKSTATPASKKAGRKSKGVKAPPKARSKRGGTRRK